jgi:hypothetical protein
LGPAEERGGPRPPGGTAVVDSHGRGTAEALPARPVRRIDLYDLVMEKVDVVAETIERRAKSPTLASYEMMDPVLDDYLESTRPLLALLAEGVKHDVDDSHEALWLEVLEQLLTFGCLRRVRTTRSL